MKEAIIRYLALLVAFIMKNSSHMDGKKLKDILSQSFHLASPDEKKDSIRFLSIDGLIMIAPHLPKTAFGEPGFIVYANTYTR